MAKRGHTSEGKTYCSECGSGIESGAETCEHCGAALTDEFQAAVCPYCATVIPADSDNCTECGLKFTSERKGRNKEDEEFLSKLLEWGKNLEAKRTEEDQEETEKATDVFKDVVGAIAPTPLQEETLKQIKRSAEERAEFEKRGESILNMAEPLKKALDLRKKSLNDLEERFKSLKGELESLSPEDLESDSKRNDIEKQLAEILVEKNTIRMLEENINNMDSAYRQLVKQHSAEIKEKEDNLSNRLAAFKKEMERREKEKQKLRAREEFLEKKEKELEDRIGFLKEREESLRQTEGEMKREIAELKAEKDGVAELKEPATRLIAGGGKWLVDAKELTGILKKSKKVREDWLKEQKNIQEDLSKGEGADAVTRESGERLGEKEIELQGKIEELEKKLADAMAEEKSIQKEEKSMAMDVKRLKKVLKVLDDLLENLPEDIVEKFAKSKNFKEYDELMQELGL